MDITNTSKESSHPLPFPHIPQMVVTSADDPTEEQSNVTECTLVLIPPAPVSMRSTKEGVLSGAVEDLPLKDLEDISVIVRDVVLQCADSASHSASHRPLVIEVDKSISPPSEESISPVRCPTPPPPLPSAPFASHPSAMQRPLVFETTVAKGDSSVLLLEQAAGSSDELHGITAITTISPTGTSIDYVVSADGASSFSKKESSHGVKKFFDSLWHPETQEITIPESDELSRLKEASSPSDAAKGEKSGLQKLFHLPKSESSKESSEPCWSFEKPSENPVDTKEPTSFTKDAKQSIKSFFVTFKHSAKDQMEGENVDTDVDGTPIESSSSQLPKQHKDSPVKAFFDNFKHPPKDQTEKIDAEVKIRTIEDIGKDKSFASQSLKEHKNSGIKLFFDTFKHPTKDQTEKVNAVLEIGTVEDIEKDKTPTPQPPKEHKDSAVKSFFDTFKHTSKDQKLKEDAEIKIGNDDAGQDKSSTPQLQKEHKDSTIKSFFDTFKHSPNDKKEKENAEIKIWSNEAVGQDKSSTSDPQKEHKDSAIKSFFDSMKLESSEPIPKSILCTKSASQPDFSKEAELPKHLEKKAELISKDTKLHKSFLYTFRKDPSDSKHVQLSASQPDVCPESMKSSKEKESFSFTKDTKVNIKYFFNTFKHEPSNSKSKQDCVPFPISKESLPLSGQEEQINKSPPTSFSKDTKQNIKAFFDGLKHDSGDQKQKVISQKKFALPEHDLRQEASNTGVVQGQKHATKKFISFKHEAHCDTIVTPESTSNLHTPVESGNKKPMKGTKSVKLDLTPTYSLNGVDNFEDFTHAERYENKIISEPKERAQSVPSEILRKNESYDISASELKKAESNLDSTSRTNPEYQKESLHSIKKFFGSFRHEKLESTKSAPHLEDSGHENSKVKIEHSSDVSKASIKPIKEKNKGIKRSFSDRLNREEVAQNFKGFFDAIGYRSPTKKSARESDHIYDTVEVRSEAGPSVAITSVPTDEPIKSATPKSEKQGIKNIFNSKGMHSKSAPETANACQDSPIEDVSSADGSVRKGILHHPNYPYQNVGRAGTTQDTPAALIASPEAKNDEDLETNNAVPLKQDKRSMLNSIGENILALKDKMTHGKENRKSYLEDSTKSPLPPEPLGQSIIVESSVMSSAQPKHSVKVKPTVPEKPVLSKQTTKVQTLPLPVRKTKSSDENSDPASPTSLYDTCCMKIAILLRDKALHIVSDQTKSPPPKPPKPSAEAIARARAAAVSRRLADSQSIRDPVLPGCENLRFADDDTESSCDYKDLENFNYIIDYELIHRYKLENKLDTFSASSGLTSYYTADISSLRDEIYSDAVMETVCLNSDVSCNVKPSSKNDSRISSSVANKVEVKKSLVHATDASKDSKVPTIKKVPPPVPPKPAFFQNISKIKEKSGESAISPSLNGLSLSPRLQSKFPKDPTQKRPLMVADVKGTQFSSLPHSKLKTTPKKPVRNFETVLKNESLKSVSSVEAAQGSTTSPSDKALPLSQAVSPLSSAVIAEKRTVSPPRPPPPNIAKKHTPQRPPPPDKGTLKKFKEHIEKQKLEWDNSPDNLVNSFPQSVASKNVESSSNIPLDFDKRDLDAIVLTSSDSVNNFDKMLSTDTGRIPIDSILQEKEAISSVELDLNSNQVEVNNNITANKDIADSLNNNIDRSQEVFPGKPKPPPRGHRIRSRTVEVSRKSPERIEERLKRSQSLSDMDVEKRVTFLEIDKSRMDGKSLYSSVNKNGKHLNNQNNTQSSPDLVSGRPLPPPPPPPRKFRSLERKFKKGTDETHRNESSSPVKPPARRRKTERERYFSLHTEPRTETDLESDCIQRASSMPNKPDRKMKSLRKEYDINANISNLHDNSSSPNIPADCVESIRKSRSTPKDADKCKTSHSSWYDEREVGEESWETINTLDLDEDLKFSPKVPLRRKSDSKRKMRETSKFYVNIEQERTSLSLVDKETSPLPLDCLEKSVQTSLETLSQGIISSRDVSHDDQSEDTDELLDLAQTLQKELSTIINRHKLVNDSSEETPSPPLSVALFEKNVAEDSKDPKKISSVRSSTSEVWPLTSSDESEVEDHTQKSLNLNEVALKRKQKKIFYIAREIMTSEEIFVDALKLLNVDFKLAVQSACSVLPEECLSQILNHLPQLQHLNENLLSELRDRIQNWERNDKIADIIVKMGPFLKLYSWYIHDFEANVALLEDCKKKYPAFAQVVREFEASPRCKRLALHHYMLKPIQRIPQYRLLLQEYLQQLGGEDHADYQDTVTALQIVSEVANHANESMKQGDNAQKLISLQNSILGHKEIVKPGRVFVKEGELMKLSRKGMQPRWFVLFNDLLLYLTNVQQGLFRMNHELPLTGMKVAIPIQQDYQNEFSIISVTRSFTLAARSPEERQEWIIALTKSIEENASKRSTFTNTRLLQQKAHDHTPSSEEESGGGGFVLGRKAPVWIPDARVTMCQLCTSEFTVTFRRHHCRACGKVVCSICSSHRISLPYLGNRIARVCDECHMRLGQGSSACTESGETDSENQQIALKSHLRTDNIRHPKKNKRSLPSVLKEVCANDQGSTISGYLHILRDKGRGWKREWFVLKDKVFYQYRASEDVAALRSIPLLGYQIELFSESHEGVEAILLFQLTHPGQPPVIFYTDTSASTERWVSALKTATVLE